MTGTARLQLPLLSTGQAQKEVTLNEALQNIDVLMCGAVEEGPRQNPPVLPALGSCYVTGSSPTGEWTGKPGYIAAFTSGGWRLYPPTDGVELFNKAGAEWISYRDGAWEQGIVRGCSLVIGGQQVIGARQRPITDPTGGSVIDVEARAAMGAVLAAMRQHGLIAI